MPLGTLFTKQQVTRRMLTRFLINFHLPDISVINSLQHITCSDANILCATGVCGLKLLVYEALRATGVCDLKVLVYLVLRATSVCGLKLLVYLALRATSV